LKPELLEKVKIIKEANDKTGKQQLKNAFTILSYANHNTKFLFVWDNDAADSVNNLPEIRKCFKFCFSKNSSNEIGGIENVYSTSFITDDLFDEITVKHSRGKKSETSINKTKVLQKVKQQNDKKVFSGFEELVQKIESILQHD
jgi:hypothetical protein